MAWSMPIGPQTVLPRNDGQTMAAWAPYALSSAAPRLDEGDRTVAASKLDVEKILHRASPNVYRQRREVIPVPKNRTGQNRRHVDPHSGDIRQRVVQAHLGCVRSRVTKANAALTVDPP